MTTDTTTEPTKVVERKCQVCKRTAVTADGRGTDQTCARCVGTVRDHIKAIGIMATALLGEAIRHPLDSDSVALAGPVADPEVWTYRRSAMLAQRVDPSRGWGKTAAVGRLYGSGAASLARDNGVSEAVARQVLDALDRLAPRLASWSAEQRYAVEAGHLTYPTYSGRVIHMAGIRNRAYAATNYAIQGTARELLVDALMRWGQTPWGGATLFPVHDELVVMVPEADAEQATAALVTAMETTLDLAGLPVPIVAEASTPSFAWKDAA